MTKIETMRRGSMLLELIMSTALLAALLIIVSQVIVRLQTQSKLVDQHFVAQQTLQNLLEELTTSDWQDLNTASISELKVPVWVQSKLPEAKLTGDVASEAEPVVAKRITLNIVWLDATRTTRRPLSLTTWVYRQTGDQR